MKMAAAMRVVVWAACAALAQATLPNSDQVPVPAGWHVVEFTKGADSASESGNVAASPEQAALSALAAEPDKAAASPEAEEGNAAHEAEAGQQDNSLAEALGNLQPYAPPQPEAAVAEAAAAVAEAAQPAAAKPLAATSEVAATESPQPLPSSDQAASAEANADGIPIPAGYRIEGFTPGAGSAAAVLPLADSAVSKPVPPLSATPPLPSATQIVAAAATDVVPRNEGVVASQPAPASNAQDLKVEGLDVPAGWAITSVIADDSKAASDSSPPLATAKAAAPPVSSAPPATAKAAVAKAKVSPMPVVATAAVSVQREHKPSYHFQGIAQDTLKATVEAIAAAQPRNSVDAASDVGTMAGAPTLTEATVDGALSYATGQQEQAAAPFVAPETLQRITSVECLTQTIDNDGRPCDGSKAPPAVASQIASTGILDSLASGAQQLMSQMGLFGSHVDIKPALRKTMLTKGSAHAVQENAQVAPQQKQAPLLTKAAAHPVQAITKVAAQEPPQFGTADTEPLMEVHPHLRRHREDHVTQVEDNRYSHKHIRVVQHNKVGQQVEQKPATQKRHRDVHEHKKVRVVAHVEEETASPDKSMADLVASSD